MESFALKVDLTAFFDDIYEKVMILVDVQWGNVAKAEKKIKKLFKIDCDIGFKNEEGYYIPSEEPVVILKHVVAVIAFKRTFAEIHQDRSEAKVIENVEPIPTTEFAKKKRSRHVLNDFTTSTPAANLAKKPKVLDTIVPNSTCDSVVTQISKSNADMFLENKSGAAVKSTKKSKTQNSTKATKETSYQDKNANISKPTSSNHSASKVSSQAHIFFNDSEEELSSESNSPPKSPKKEILLVCNLENARNKKGRIFPIGTITPNGLENNVEHNENGIETKHQNSKELSMSIEEIDENSLPKSSEPMRSNNETNISSKEISMFVLDASLENDENNLAKSDVYNNDTKNSSHLTKSGFDELTQSNAFTESLISCDESAIMELNESEMVNSSVDYTQKSMDVSCQNVSAELNEYCVENMLPKSSELINPPGIGDFVIFKIKLANGKISDFFVGRCEYINKRTKTLKLQLTDGLSQIARIPSKFACNIDDSDVKSLNIKLQDMLDAKICQT